MDLICLFNEANRSLNSSKVYNIIYSFSGETKFMPHSTSNLGSISVLRKYIPLDESREVVEIITVSTGPQVELLPNIDSRFIIKFNGLGVGHDVSIQKNRFLGNRLSVLCSRDRFTPTLFVLASLLLLHRE